MDQQGPVSAMQIAQVRASLGAYDGRSPSALAELAVRFHNEPGFLDCIVDLAASEEERVSEGATWILKSALEAGGSLDAARTERLIASLDKVTAWQARLHVCQIVRRLEVPGVDEDRLRAWLLDRLGAERPFLRAWALDALCSLAGTADDSLLEKMAEDPAASVRARVRNLRKDFERRRPKDRS
ncbi:hypothetical protein [Anianabacter salinae]|uniref:hypothetical protein n=1 Tax=Anianabacter salinae TaxID=2851023 RepID=UPI00225DE5E7|nr:hypothetical protein [Anianabacter salinae]MBV0913768.1 hypothetical protein [Anianabacter salinae]